MAQATVVQVDKAPERKALPEPQTEEEHRLCPIHGESMTQSISKRTGKPVWWHKWPAYTESNGFCNGHEPKAKPVDGIAQAEAQDAEAVPA